MTTDSPCLKSLFAECTEKSGKAVGLTWLPTSSAVVLLRVVATGGINSPPPVRQGASRAEKQEAFGGISPHRLALFASSDDVKGICRNPMNVLK